MNPQSPDEALGGHAEIARQLVVDLVRTRHDLAAEAHAITQSRSAAGFATQWRDLLNDAESAFKAKGHRLHTLRPGGYRVPVVNGALVYVWRVRDTAEAVAHFPSSPTRLGAFDVPSPDPTLFDGVFTEEFAVVDPDDDSRVEALQAAVREALPVVVVLVWSTPRQLRLIEWALGKVDAEGNMELLGREALWRPEQVTVVEQASVDAFDSGAPEVPVVAIRAVPGTSDA